jgi:hypothetical protein
MEDSIDSKTTTPPVYQRAERKKRATNEIIKTFVKWCFNNGAFTKYTNGRIRQLYLDETGVDLATSTINNQRERWVLYDGELYDKNKGWLIPNKEDSE